MRYKQGFTVIELIIAMSILLLIFSLAFVNLTRLPSSFQQSASVDLLLTDIKSQQVKAMSGDTSGSTKDSYGIYFGDGYYILFKGDNFVSSEPNNFRVNLESYLSFTNVTFPGQVLIFNLRNGEIKDFSEVANGFSLLNSETGEVKSFKINKYGAIYE